MSKLVFILISMLIAVDCNSQVKVNIDDGINHKYYFFNPLGFHDVFRFHELKWYEDFQLGTLTCLFNSSNSQVMELISAPGSGKFEFRAFNLFIKDSTYRRKGAKINIDSFQTNHGFYLGMYYKPTDKRFNEFKISKKDGFLVLTKRVEEDELYFERLYFRNQRLFRIYFGYDNP